MIYVLLIIGFILLVKGADVLVAGASSLAKRLKISDIVIGLTVVSFGTSMPELVVNVISSNNGSSDLAIGNVLGSNISNILLILGISAMIAPLPILRNTVLSEIPFSLIATLLVGFLANASLFESQHQLQISRYDASLLLFFFVLFMFYIFMITKENRDETETETYEELSVLKSVLYVLSGCFALFLGGKWVVDGAIELAQSFGMSESFIGLTVVAVGTSLPELVTSAMAAYRGNTDIAVGNVVGSNIFNLLWILGLSALIKPLPFKLLSNTDIGMLIFSSTLLFVALMIGRRNVIDRWNGVTFVVIYISYISYLVVRG
ncbi:MAG: sodium:proton exchanger [Candidatus Wallbacteria bacterium HGW-Wallbacteria-1]|jgi:cation:H+ antiporter|uniref:Sodium:proton exchanger n=1 Tax=Candidatus Wallbacteria bacterium HGW-Wallbacteria-1 TaxID=2013854 RepID=A0A2N1PMX5_9BACT|nr:MAG: sodium:proton exchanger [Candidatus Wallbacteria bacterium HGW-Wallbacteria-1]